MQTGVVSLVLAYVLSQFYRAFLAVLAPALKADLGATPADLSYASGMWFVVFAAMQIPVGAALDRIGPRRTAAVLFALGGAGGALVCALAQSPLHIVFGMVLLGVGCSPVLMASYFIFARVYSPAVFGTLAGVVLGVGSLGNVASSVPLAWAAEAVGWRGTLFGLAAISLAIAALIAAFVTDPPKAEAEKRGSVLDILKIPALWLILPLMFVNYAPSAGTRGLWVGPYMADVFGADAARIGLVSLVMGLAMIAGNFAYGPLDRWLGTRKWGILGGNLLGAAACFALAGLTTGNIWTVTVLLALVGFFGASFPQMIAHGRAFFPAHLTGRGVSLLNLFVIAGVGAMQFVTGRVHAARAAVAETPADPYATLFLLYGALLLAGVAIYAFSRDRTD
ncbi:MAG: MFS transporter [Salibaculum sp.]|uniref:MFS transporter n=1 Tax=Salibaculum sp. TaxID=2855480 RepID=UPI00287044A5|nr:MFS transporter [Salibaculum sp.]MDR9428509.1 MFS transporter [Salibaculum sp.]